MRTRFVIALVAALLAAPLAQAADGLIVVSSPHSVPETLDRLEIALKEKGVSIFARIDHAAQAEKVGKTLRPTQLLIFGNPKVGTLLMQAEQTVAIDLPMKALAWKDAQGQVHLGYNDPGYLAKRHGIGDRDAVLKKIRGLLKGVTAQATR